ncbi:hypothetical protein AGMMS50229_00370 [Campylobacterota bacterium]|nr:hypothetical protein AGMMS50229_00370 [Campylobacterota bacterium]
MTEVFNIANVGFLNIYVIHSVLISAVSFIVPLYMLIRRKYENKLHAFVLVVLLLFAPAYLYEVLPSMKDEYTILHSIYDNQTYQIAEGYITDYHSRSNLGNYVVNGIKFEYFYNIVTYAHNNTRLQGSPLKNGVYVKIYYTDLYNNQIIALWIDNEK